MLKAMMEEFRQIALEGDPQRCAEVMGGLVEQKSPFRSEGRFGQHVVVIDEPKAFGGTDEAANPAEVLMAAVGTSLAVTLRCHAALRGLTLGRIAVRIDGALDIRGFFGTDPAVRSGFGALTLQVEIESKAPRQALQDLLQVAQRACPVLDSCAGATPITLTLKA